MIFYPCAHKKHTMFMLCVCICTYLFSNIFFPAKYPESAPSARRRYLGVTMLTLNESIIQELQARGSAPHSIPADVTHGIFIWKVVVGSPAYQ